MVSFTPTEEQQQLIDTIKRFAATTCSRSPTKPTRTSASPPAIVKTGWDIGLVQSAIPEEFGGLGELSAVTGVLAAEAFAKGDLSTALQVMTPALFAYPVILYGTAEQREHFLPLFLEDHLPHVSAALLEPGIFFDPHALKTTATVHDDKVTLNGEKAYVPLAATADWMLVYARDSESGKVDAYLLEVGTKGVTVGRREQLMGIHALPTHPVSFRCRGRPRLPAGRRVGQQLSTSCSTAAGSRWRRWRSAWRMPPPNTPANTPSSASPSACRLPRSRRLPSCWRRWRLKSMPPG